METEGRLKHAAVGGVDSIMVQKEATITRQEGSTVPTNSEVSVTHI